jgi:CHAT domain
MTLRDVRPPDLEMQVHTAAEHGKTRLSFILHAPTGAIAFSHRKIAGPVLQSSPDAYQAHLLRTIEGFGQRLDIDGSPLLRDEIDRKMAGLGRDLWRELFPPEIRSAYREIRRSVRSWMIVSDEPYIPWELVKPYDNSRPDEVIDDDFLSLQFELTRWLAGDWTPALQIAVRRIAVFRTDSDLPQAQQELSLLTELAKSLPGVESEAPRVTSAADLLSLLETTQAEILHFIGHGTRADGNPDNAGIPFKDRSVLRPGDLDAPLAAQISRRRPLVFLNACWAGQQGWSLTGLGGWTMRWVSLCGAGAFIAPLWPARDQTALAFARTLYEALASGAPLGAAALEARSQVRRERSGDPSALLYTVYGHPGARVCFGEEPPAQEALGVTETSRVVRVEWAPPKTRRRLTRVWATAAGLGFAVFLHFAGASFTDLLFPMKERPAPATTKTGKTFQDLMIRPESKPAATRPAPRMTSTMTAGVLTFKVSGGQSSLHYPMKEALRRAAGPLIEEGISGWTISLTLEAPEITPLVQGERTLQSCRLAGRAGARSSSRNIDLGPVSTRNSQFDRSKACEAATVPLAEAALERFASSIRKEGEP